MIELNPHPILEPEENGPSESEIQGFQLDGKIQLAEVPDSPRRAVQQASPSQIVTPHTAIQHDTAITDEPELVRFAKIKKFIGRGFFDPFHAFYEDLDLPKLKKAQLFLCILAIVGPFVFFAISSLAAALVYQVLAAINSVTLPNSFYEFACYPMAYLIVKGYWIAYLILPASAILLGWLWAAASAWILARGSDHGFRQFFFIFAMLGTMFAPFTLFPFLRIVAILVLGIYTFKRMSQYFGIGFLQLMAKAGIIFIAVSISYAWIEYKVESNYPLNTNLATTMQDYYFKKKPLEWPSFSPATPVSPCQTIIRDLGSLDSATREKATRAALEVISTQRETPEVRFQVAQQLAKNGRPEAMTYLSQAYRTGVGTTIDLAVALDWIQQANRLQPNQMQFALQEAHLLCANNRRLDGKHLFVATAKSNLSSLDKINAFLAANGYGTPPSGLIWSITNLYNHDKDGSDYPTYSNRRNFSRYDDSDYIRDQKNELMRRIADSNNDGSQWFYRALVAEYKTTAFADPEVYGEPRPTANELLSGNEMNPEALDVAGDKAESQGNFVQARECWRRAANALNSDNRKPNAHFYFKLAKSFDPSIHSAPVGDAKEAARYYLAFLLLGESTNAQNKAAFEALNQVGIPLEKDYDPMSPKFVNLCTRYDVPEAWAILGSYYVGGSVSGIPKNTEKAKSCFQKAIALGYQGPVVHMLDKASS